MNRLTKDDKVCFCAACGNPIYSGENVFGIKYHGYKIIICTHCAELDMDLEAWLNILHADHWMGEAERVDMWLNAEILRDAERIMNLARPQENSAENMTIF